MLAGENPNMNNPEVAAATEDRYDLYLGRTVPW
jgi:hypothetical protein